MYLLTAEQKHESWLVSHTPKYTSQTLCDVPFCTYFKYESKVWPPEVYHAYSMQTRVVRPGSRCGLWWSKTHFSIGAWLTEQLFNEDKTTDLVLLTPVVCRKHVVISCNKMPHVQRMYVTFPHKPCRQTTNPSFDNAACLAMEHAELRYTVLPEIFARVLFSLNFAVGVGPCKLSARNFLRTRFVVY